MKGGMMSGMMLGGRWLWGQQEELEKVSDDLYDQFILLNVWNFQRIRCIYLKIQEDRCIHNKKEFKGKETIKSVQQLSSILDAALKENSNKAEPEKEALSVYLERGTVVNLQILELQSIPDKVKNERKRKKSRC